MGFKLSVWLKKACIQEVLYGLLTIGCVYLGFCCSTLEHIDRRFMLPHLLMVLAAGAFYMLLCKRIISDRGMYGQFLMWNTVYCLCAVTFFLFGIGSNIRGRKWYELLSQLVLMLIAVCAQYLLLRRTENIGTPLGGGNAAGSQKCRMKNAGELLKQYKYLIVLCVAALLLALDPDMVQFKWDGSSYYETNNAANLYSVSSMALYGHPCHTFSMLNLFYAAMFGGNMAYGMVCGNLTVYIISICAVYGILRHIVRGIGELQVALGTAVYALSPFALGMVNYYGLDFYCMCLFTVVMYYTVKKQWLLQFICGMFFVFTKEPAILIYGMICVGVVLGELLSAKGQTLAGRIKGQFFRARNYAMLLVAATWLVTVMMIGFWGGEGGFGLNGAYIVDKLKVLCILNFGWLFTAVIVAGGFIMGAGGIVAHKHTVKEAVSKEAVANGNADSGKRDWMLPFLLGGIGYFLFSLLFKTVNHPRYAAMIPVWLYILAVYVLGCLFRGLWRGRLLSAILAALAALMLVSSYKTIDPVSKAVFRTFETGGGEMISTGGEKTNLGDAIIYNKQALWLERALGNAMQNAVASDDMIVFPVVNNSPYFFNGFPGIKGAGHVETGSYGRSTEYWNVSANRREMLRSGDHPAFEVYEVTDGQSLYQAVADGGGGRIAYFYLEADGGELADVIREEYTVLEEEIFSYRGWNVYRIVFRR